jgi:hypothetical protein
MSSVKLCDETIDQVLEREPASERREGIFTVNNYESISLGMKIADIIYGNQPRYTPFSLRITQDTELKLWDAELTILLNGQRTLCDPNSMRSVDMRAEGYVDALASKVADYATMADCRLTTDERRQLKSIINEEVFPKQVQRYRKK